MLFILLNHIYPTNLIILNDSFIPDLGKNVKIRCIDAFKEIIHFLKYIGNNVSYI